MDEWIWRRWTYESKRVHGHHHAHAGRSSVGLVDFKDSRPRVSDAFDDIQRRHSTKTRSGAGR